MGLTGMFFWYLTVQLVSLNVLTETWKPNRLDEYRSRAAQNGEELVLVSPAKSLSLEAVMARFLQDQDPDKELKEENIGFTALTKEEQKTRDHSLKEVASVSNPALDKSRPNLAAVLKVFSKSLVRLQTLSSNQTKQTTSVKKELQILKSKLAEMSEEVKLTRGILDHVQNSNVSKSSESRIMAVIDTQKNELNVMKKEFAKLGDIGVLEIRLEKMRTEVDRRLSGQMGEAGQCRLLDQQIAMLFEFWPLLHRAPETGSVKVSIATQSSIGWGAVASRAIDGRKEAHFRDRSCSHTLEERHPWLLLKLVGLSRVTGVELTNRGDCCHQRLSNFSIEVFTSDPTHSNGTGELCKHYTGTVGKAATELIKCNSPIIGRYVKIRLNEDTHTMLTVCEAVVKGKPLNKLLGKPTLQSSVVLSSSLSDKAIDGNKTTCSETLTRSDGSAPWWMVDMGEVISVQKVYFLNRQDEKYASLRNLSVTVHDTFPSVCTEVTSDICRTYPGIIGRGRVVELSCKQPIRGRYLKIRTAGNDGKATLSLCEVSVNKPMNF